jgi:hypothetical protein
MAGVPVAVEGVLELVERVFGQRVVARNWLGVTLVALGLLPREEWMELIARKLPSFEWRVILWEA